MPAAPAPKSIEFKAQEIVALSISPFTGQAQVQDWQAGYWQGSVTMPPMAFAAAQAWVAFLLQLRGQANVFQMGFPDGVRPRGSTIGTNVVSDSSKIANTAAQTGYSVQTRGWTPLGTGLLLPGDWLQIGYRLYRNLDPVNADSSGRATLNLWPALREPIGDGTALTFLNTVGIWRLASNTRAWSVSEGMVYGFQFDIREAI